jgi:hypothetical protein
MPLVLKESRVMRKRLGLFFLICGVQLHSTALFAAENVREDVLALLQGYEWQFDATRFAALPSDAYLTVLNIIEDESIARFIRGRAMVALTLYPNADVWDFYQSNIQASNNTVSRRRFVEASCAGFLASNPQGLADLLVPLLESSDPHLRAHSANCLRRVNDDHNELNLAVVLANYESTIAEDWERRIAGFDRDEGIRSETVSEKPE